MPVSCRDLMRGRYVGFRWRNCYCAIIRAPTERVHSPSVVMQTKGTPMKLVSEAQQSLFESLPSPQSCRLLDFESAEVLVETPLGYPSLFVHGEKPYQAMTVTLQTLYYVQQPEYWGFEVVGCLPSGPVTDVTGKYVVILPLDETMGTKGIEIIGATGSKRIDVALPADPGPQYR